MKSIFKMSLVMIILFVLQSAFGQSKSVFTGIYRNDKSDVLRIKLENDKLFIYNYMNEKWELKQVSSTLFLMDKSSPQASCVFFLNKNKVEKFIASDFNKISKSEFIKISHFAFYMKNYIILSLFIGLMFLFYIMRKNGFRATICSYHWMDSGGTIHDQDDIVNNLVVTDSPTMDKLLDRGNWFDKLFDRLYGKKKK